MKKGITWYAHRIMRMDAREIIWRVRSLLRELVETARILTHTVPAVSGALPEPGFVTTKLSASEHLQSLSTEQAKELRRYADALLDNNIEFFGRSIALGEDIDWRRDWNQSLTPPLRLSLRTDYRNATDSGDCKEVWEPNRHHQLVVLARAYHAFQEPRYADKVASLLQDWLAKNPYGYGMNWRSPLELGIRLINWVWALDLIRDSGAVSPELSEDLHQAAFLQCRDLASKFSQGSSANNHLIGEAAGLFVAASYWFAEQKPEWIATSRAILERELVAQQTESGCTAEQALNYQFFVAQFYVVCGCVDHWTTNSLSPSYWAHLGRYLSFIEKFRGFEEQLPLFGDQDDGYVLNLGYHPHSLEDYRGWLMALRGEPMSGHSPSALLLGRRPFASDVTPHIVGVECNTGASAIEVLKDAGYAFLRSAQHGIAVLMDAGPLGYGSMAAHGHADALHFAYSIDGHALFVDSGTYDYFTYPELRNYFRSTRAHNTISIDDTDQSSMSGPFMWNRAAEASFVAQDDDATAVAVTGSISRYQGIDEKCRSISRTLTLDQHSGELSITDSIELNSKAKVSHFFHLHPDVSVAQLTDSSYRLGIAGRELIFEVSRQSYSTLVTDGELAQFSPAYHQMQTGSCIVAHAENASSGEYHFSLKLSETKRGAA